MIMSGKQFSLDSRYSEYEEECDKRNNEDTVRIDLAEAVEEAKEGSQEVVERIEEV